MIDDVNEIILYDVKDEFKKQLNVLDDDSNLLKWQKYQNYKVNRYSVYGIDCDVSLYAVNIYKRAWEFLKPVNRPTRQYEKVSLDKLESFSISIDSSSETIIPCSNILSKNKTYICFSREYKYQLILDTNNGKEYYRGDTMTSFTNIHKHYETNFANDETISFEIEKLAKNYHTIGNMIPVPTGFNTSRAGSNAVHDYWDLTMIKIKEWYDKSIDKPLAELFHKNSDAIEPCKKWLSKFNKWNDFVEKNYLLSFVGDKDQDGNYQLLMFWNKHDFNNSALPINKEDFFRFLKLLNICIENRNKEISVALK